MHFYEYTYETSRYLLTYVQLFWVYKKNIVYIFFAAQILHSVLEKINYFFNKMGKNLENFFNIQLMPFVFIILRKKHKTNAILLLN